MVEKVEFDLVGQDGNAISLLISWKRAARNQGWDEKEIEKVIEEASSSDYDNLIKTLMDHSE